MTDLKLVTKILGILYQKYFENHIVGILWRNIDTVVGGEKNEISKAVQLLENEYLIENYDGWYRITSSGIERYEEILSPSEINERVTQRKMILEFLKKEYDKDTLHDVDIPDLENAIKNKTREELFSQVKYLDDIGLVHWQPYSGGFFVRLTAEGASRFEKYEKHDYHTMSSAYRILFLLENNLRNFVEKKLIQHYGSEWWQKGISQKLREKVDSRKKDESNFPWKVSITKSDMEYLQFPDLSRIIRNQDSIFKTTFSDISQIELRLNELEEIRNSIAHTRTLSTESITRLEQYSDDISRLIQ